MVFAPGKNAAVNSALKPVTTRAVWRVGIRIGFVLAFVAACDVLFSFETAPPTLHHRPPSHQGMGPLVPLYARQKSVACFRYSGLCHSGLSRRWPARTAIDRISRRTEAATRSRSIQRRLFEN